MPNGNTPFIPRANRPGDDYRNLMPVVPVSVPPPGGPVNSGQDSEIEIIDLDSARSEVKPHTWGS